jgi:hypothetical protein
VITDIAGIHRFERGSQTTAMKPSADDWRARRDAGPAWRGGEPVWWRWR